MFLLNICLRETETWLPLSWATKLGTLKLGTHKKATKKNMLLKMLIPNGKTWEQVPKALLYDKEIQKN